MTAPSPLFGLAYDVLHHDVSLGEHAPRLYADLERAEELGYDSVWFGETHRRKPGHGHAPSPLVVAAAVAARTERLLIGTAVLLMTTSTPLQIAEQAALVDQLSRGRFLLGVAPGLEVFRDFGFTNFGFDRTDLQPMMTESLDVLRRLWTEDEVTFHGSYYDYESAACVPRPWQRPHPPVLIGGITDSALARAAALGDGWVGGTPYPFGLIVEVRRRYLEAVDALAAVADGGDAAPEAPFALIRPLIVAESDAEARELADRWVTPLIDYYLARGAYIRADFKAAHEVTPEVRAEALAEIPIVGSPDTCVAQIERYVAEAGVNHFIFRVRFPNQGDAERDRVVETLSQAVLPRLRAGTAPSAHLTDELDALAR
jgi:alkanesulfonate monooxygenase SsuD/methylene tetrahydromethanopterin reductase-like flavin-dependent oxidoreductase (luciferase family)